MYSQFARAHISLLLRLFLHVLHFCSSLSLQIAQSSSQHVFGLLLYTHHTVQPNHHLSHLGSHVSAAFHAFPPGEGAVGKLKLTQFCHLVGQSVLTQRLVQIFGQQSFLLVLPVGIHHPRCFVEHQFAQFLILLQNTLQ